MLKLWCESMPERVTGTLIAIMCLNPPAVDLRAVPPKLLTLLTASLPRG
ncbi:MAG: hypothetical protein ACKV2U_27905 [Bryobacteraceae bacterium]